MSIARGVSRRAGPVGAVAAFVGALLAGNTCLAEENRPRPLQLRIASIDITSTRPVPSVPEESTPVWRHTFGAERRAEATRRPLPIAADIVVLRGVTSLAPVRQMFPARAYYVLASRQLLQQPDGSAQSIETTALAIRRDTGLRVTAQDHLLQMAEPPPGTELRLAAGTAVRLIGHGRMIWVLALDLAQGCPNEAAAARFQHTSCQAAERQLDVVDEWLSARMASGETLIVAGRFHRKLGPDGLSGHLARLTRFGPGAMPRAPCTNDESLATTYVLAATGSDADRHMAMNGSVKVVDKSAPEKGCLLIVEASF